MLVYSLQCRPCTACTPLSLPDLMHWTVEGGPLTLLEHSIELYRYLVPEWIHLSFNI